MLTSALSRRLHGAAGTFDLPLSTVATNPTTEPRTGPLQAIVFVFDKAVNAATVAVTEGIATAAAPSFSGNDVIVTLTGVNDQQYVTLALTNVTATDGSTGGSASVRIGFLAGDVKPTNLCRARADETMAWRRYRRLALGGRVDFMSRNQLSEAVMARSLIDIGSLDLRVQEEIAQYGSLRDFSLTVWRQDLDSSGCNWNGRIQPAYGDAAPDPHWREVVQEMRRRFNLN